MKEKALSILLVLAACAYVDPTALGPASQLDPLTVDPADMAVELVWPQTSPYALASSTLQLGAIRADGQEVAGVFQLAQRGDIFEIAPQDHDRFRRLQALIAEWKADDPAGTKGTLSIAAQPCVTGPVAGDPGRLDINVRFRQDGAFLPFLRDVPIVAGVDQLTTEEIAPC